jgi:hypothetical protein
MHRELRDTPWYPKESVERLVVHDDSSAFRAESNIKLHAIALFRACHECG